MSKDSRAPTPTVEAVGKLHLEGNIVPHTFYARKEFKSSKGVTQHIAILIYADDLYWYRPTIHRDELTGQITHVTRKFQEDMLQRSYEYYAELFGISKQQATDAVKFNVERGLTRREFRTIKGRDGKRISNVMFVEPVVGALKALLELEKGDGTGWHWVTEPPKPNLKKEKGEGIPNRTDTYPEHSGYLSQIDERRIRSKRDTNTENTHKTFSETSHREKSSSIPESEAVPPSPDDDDQKNELKNQNPKSEAPHIPDQVGAGIQGGETSPATDKENVPGGGAAAASAILGLTPIPRAVLESRPSRDPAGMKTLRALMQATAPNRVDHLRDQLKLPTGGRLGLPRELLTRLTDEEVELARIAAQADAKVVKGGMKNAGYYALDAIIGEKYTLAKLKGEREAVTVSVQPSSYEVKNEGKAVAMDAPAPEADGQFRPMAMWRAKATGDAVLIRSVEGMMLTLNNGVSISMFELTQRYTFEAAPPTEASA